MSLSKQITQAVSFDFVRSGGPGGQNVNKVATAAVLSLDIEAAGFNEYVSMRLYKLYSKYINSDGILIIKAQRYRSQLKNRQEAFKRLEAMIEKARYVFKSRKKTKPSRMSEHKRLERKKNKGEKKQTRRNITRDSL